MSGAIAGPARGAEGEHETRREPAAWRGLRWPVLAPALATTVCALVDVEAHTLTVSSAGHLPPLLIGDGTGTFIQGEVGVPIDVNTAATYASTAVSTPPAATLLAFTDGLVERRGESIDAGLERLQHAAITNHSDLEGLLSRLLEELRHDSDDDTAIAGLRWLD